MVLRVRAAKAATVRTGQKKAVSRLFNLIIASDVIAQFVSLTTCEDVGPWVCLFSSILQYTLVSSDLSLDLIKTQY